jgi:hypothetical protein
MKKILTAPEAAPEGQVWIGLASAGGAGSWYRSKSLSEVVAQVPRRFRTDFKGLGVTPKKAITFAAFLVNDVDCRFEYGNVIPDDGSEQHLAVKFTQEKSTAPCIPVEIWEAEGEEA